MARTVSYRDDFMPGMLHPALFTQPPRTFQYIPGDESYQNLLDLLSLYQTKTITMTDDILVQLQFCYYIGCVFSERDKSNIDKFIKYGALSHVMKFLDSSTPTLRSMAAWAMAHLTSGHINHIYLVISANLVPKLLSFLDSGPRCEETILWILGNIIAESNEIRDFFVECGSITHLMNAITDVSNLKRAKIATWAFSHVLRGTVENFEEQENFEILFNEISTSINLLWPPSKLTSAEAVLHSMETMFWIVKTASNQLIEHFFMGHFDDIVELVAKEDVSWDIKAVTLRTLGRVALIITDFRNSGNLIRTVKTMLEETDSLPTSILREVCWLGSIITAGSVYQLNDIINLGFFPPLFPHLKEERLETDIVRYGLRGILNATNGPQTFIRKLCTQGFVDIICSILNRGESRVIVCNCLDGLDNILSVEGRGTQSCSIIIDTGTLHNLCSLMESNDDEIRTKAVNIVKSFFPRISTIQA
ncbi:importin subunit alpha-like isoform X1 [Vicia villosa]|uniref:importin subunit alpha-like isoform X1 n=1 Tax=Vicia villosa TaxID=3911 RepID=UPI00273B4D7A|nr:importin subunit alpha-like isoform X1 [Vicia villosa]